MPEPINNMRRLKITNPIKAITMEPNSDPEPLSQNLWWVIPGKLAGVRKPLETELQELQALGIGAIISVMDDPGNLELYTQAGIPHCWLPVTGGKTPSPEQLEHLWAFVNYHQNKGRAVAIHCSSGRRRTGTMIGAYLIRNGMSYNDALARINQANPHVDLRDAQLQFLRELAASSDRIHG